MSAALPHLASALALFGKKAGRPPRLCRLGSRRGWGAAEASPRICGKPGSGKVFQKFPAAPAQVASAGRADSGKPASLAAAAAASAATAASSALWAARSLAGSGPDSRRAGPPPGAKAAADAGGSEGGSCPLRPLRQRRGAYTWGPDGWAQAPGPRRSRGLLGRYRAPRVSEQRTLASSSPHPAPLPSWLKAPEGGNPP